MTSLHRLASNRRARILALAVLLAGLALAADIGSTGSWTRLLLYKIASDGDPILVNLHVVIPEVDADECGVAVYRYPTVYAPTPGRGMELVWAGKTDPGDRVKATSLVEDAPPVKYDGGEPVYREPQEYRVVVHCYDVEGDRARLKASGALIVEVRPDKPVVDIEVHMGLREPSPFKPGGEEGDIDCIF